MNNLRLLYCLALLLLLEGCASKGPRTTCVAIDEEQVLNSYLKGDNLRATINRMARSLVASRALNTEDGSQPKITFTGIEDKTIRGVDTYNLQSCIRKNLTIANIVFLDGSSDVVHQGVHDVARGTPDQFADSDYILEGALFETGRSELTKYYRLSFRLMDRKTGNVVWCDDYEMKYLQEHEGSGIIQGGSRVDPGKLQEGGKLFLETDDDEYEPKYLPAK